MTSTAGGRAADPAPASTSPAERYARAVARARTENGPLGTFRRQYPFELDDFQLRASAALNGAEVIADGGLTASFDFRTGSEGASV